MQLRTRFASAGLLALAGMALAGGPPVGYGVVAPNGSKFTSTLTVGGDCDDYVFEGTTGMKLNASVKADSAAKKAGIALKLVILRPDGTVAGTPDLNGDTGLPPVIKDKGTSVKATHTLDQTGIWKVRVQTVEPTQGGGYSTTVKYTPPKFKKVKGLTANPDLAQFAFEIPGDEGASITATFSYKGGEADIAFLSGPTGGLIDIPAGNVAVKAGKSIQIKNLVLPQGSPLGRYLLVLNDIGLRKDPPEQAVGNASFALSVKLPKGPPKRKGTLSAKEPFLQNTSPPVGGNGTRIQVSGSNLLDESAPDAFPKIFIDDIELEDIRKVDLQGNVFNGRVPTSVGPVGSVYDVIVETSTGQVAVSLDAFEVVGPPTVTAISQPSGSDRGGYPLTITGEGFRPRTNPNAPHNMLILIDSFNTVAEILDVTPTSVTFTAPGRPAGFVVYGVQDKDSQLRDELGLNSFQYLSTPTISRVLPNLVPVTGGETITVTGVNFSDGTSGPPDTVFLETETPGVFEAMTLTASTDQRHSFTAPVRAKGSYKVYMRDPQGNNTPANPNLSLFTLSYFTFADFTPTTGLDNIAGSDLFDAFTTEVADYDLDGDDDLFLSYVGTAGPVATPQTRVLRNDGSGAFTDVTASVMPRTTNTDDWRANRVRVANVAGDAYPDIVIVTNSLQVPAEGNSHVRMLISAPRAGGAGESDRVFSDQTASYMAPVRLKSPFSFGGGNTTVGDNWRGQDMWIGDIDNSGTIPEILITHDEVKNEPNVNCGNYCTSPLGGGATYNMYWGGSRAFRWDPTAAGGSGRFKFDSDFFPRKSGVGVPIAIPGGGQIIGCSQPCVGKFTPFTGQRLAVGSIDGDGKLDVAVLSNGVVTREGATISSLQVAVNRANVKEGSSISDVTHKLTEMGGDFKGDAVAIGQPFDAFGVLAVSKRTPVGGNRALRLIQAKAAADPEDPLPDFTDVGNAKLPNVGTNDKFQAADMQFIDANGDGIQDLVLVAPTPPGGNEMAFRILRTTAENNEIVMRETLKGLIGQLSGSDYYDGDVLSIGDLDGDGGTEFIVTRTTPVGTDSQTRVISIDK